MMMKGTVVISHNRPSNSWNRSLDNSSRFSLHLSCRISCDGLRLRLNHSWLRNCSCHCRVVNFGGVLVHNICDIIHDRRLSLRCWRLFNFDTFFNCLLGSCTAHLLLTFLSYNNKISVLKHLI